MADSAPLNDVARQRLSELIENHGPALCKDQMRCEALLRDLCGEYRREAFVLLSALKSGAVAELLPAAEGVGRAPLLTALAGRMQDESMLSTEVCQWAVEAWAAALGLTGRSPRKTPTKPVIEPAATSSVPPPSAEHRRIAAAQFQRANQVISSGNYDYGIQLLLTCCKLDPANLIYRQALRRTEKVKYKNNLKGSALAILSTSAIRAKIKSAKRSGEHLKVLEYGEEVLAKNPWDTGVQLDMAESAEELGLVDKAVWILEQARQKDPNDPAVNRPLARLYEKRGNYAQAVALWELVRRAIPADPEASSKVKDVAAHATILRGNYDEAAAPTEKRDSGVARAADRLAREVAPVLDRIKAQPTNPDHYLQLANIYRRSGNLERAQAALEQGLGPTGNHFQLTFALADLVLEPFRRDLAILEDKIKEDPDDEDLRRQRLRLLKEINSRELEVYRQKADRFPTDGGYRLELGIRLLRAGQVDEAIRELQLARNDSRYQWRALIYLGHCFKARNNWRLAERNFEEALRAIPTGEDASRKEVLFQLAQGCADSGDLAKALELGHELANLDFGYRDIGRLLDEWQERLQQA